MRRVALVVPEYRTRQAPGGGLAAVTDFLTQAFIDDGDWNVSIVSPRMWRRAEENRRVLSPGTWLRGPVARLAASSEAAPVTYVGADWAEFEFMRYRPRAVLDEALAAHDVLILVTGTPAAFGVARRMRTPMLGQVATTVLAERQLLVQSARGSRSLLLRMNRAITASLDASSVGLPNVVVVENEWMRTWCVEHGTRAVLLIPPGVDTDVFSPGTGSSAGYILSVGRLNDRRKDIPTLFRSYERAVRVHRTEQRLVIAGRSVPSTDVLALLDELDIRDRVSVRTDVSVEELVDLYRGADFFVMSSSEEGLGIVMQEAMGCGLAVVTTATEGAKTVVGDSDAGTIVEFADDLVDRLALTIGEYAKDEELRSRCGRAARERALGVFSSRAIGPRFVGLARSLVEGLS